MKVLASLICSLALVLGASAQNHKVFDLLNGYRAVVVSNAASITNLSLYSGVTNRNNVVFTNKTGARIITGVTNNTVNLLGSAPLWVDREGHPFSTNNFQAPATVIVDSYQTSSDTNVLTVILAPVWEGVVDTLGNKTYSVSTATADWFSFQVTPGSGGVPSITPTNLPMARWAGAKEVALVRLATTNTAETTNQIVIRKVRIVGLQP